MWFCSLCVKLHFDLHNTGLFLLFVTSGVLTEQHTAAPLRRIIYLVAALGKYLHVQPVAVFGAFQMPTTGLCVFLRTTVRELLMLLLTLINEITMQAISSSCLPIILCAFPPHFFFFFFFLWLSFIQNVENVLCVTSIRFSTVKQWVTCVRCIYC